MGDIVDRQIRDVRKSFKFWNLNEDVCTTEQLSLDFT